MATIAISELRPVGTSLFVDPESYLTDISDDSLTDINGGLYPILGLVAYSSIKCGAAISFVASAVVGYFAN